MSENLQPLTEQEISARLTRELPHWYYENGWIRRKYRTGGWKGTLYNTFFVGAFNALPKRLVRRFGWHLLAFCEK